MVGLVIIGTVVLLYALSATVLDRFSITGPLVLLVAGVVLGDGGLDVLHISVSAESLRVLAEIALAIILFSDASSISVSSVRGEISTTGRLLGIGLPLTIALGTLVCHLCLPAASWATCALVGSLLAPTDAALGLAVVTNPTVPLGVREALSIEGGLNDGLATPFVYFFIALTLSESTAGHWMHSLAELAGGIGVGIVLGGLAGWLCQWACRRLDVGATQKQLAFVISGLVVFAAALSLGCNGFVAAYVAGFAFAVSSKGALDAAKGLSDEAGIYTSFAVWVLFGVAVAGPILRLGFSWAAFGYACLSLTIVRMVPVALSMIGSKTRPITVAFIGWFGPRGLASVVFLIVAVDRIPVSGNLRVLVSAATWTIVLSVVLHGLTSRPFAAWFGRTVAEDSSSHDVPRGRTSMARRRGAAAHDVP